MSTEPKPVFGGWSPLMPVDAEMKEIFMTAKPAIEKKAETKFEVYEPLLYVSPMGVGPPTYVVKVRIDGDMCLNAKIAFCDRVDEQPDDDQPDVISVIYPAI